jgi:ABC-2 type transport system ATP-binding protein
LNDIMIQTDSLTRRFGRFTAVDNVSFQVRRGEIFGLLGANGAGKTTTIRMLTGLLEPSGGFGRVGPYDIGRQAEQVKRLVGYMSQRFSLYTDLTAMENVEFFAGVYRIPQNIFRERSRKLLESVGLWEVRKMMTGAMPMGVRQRLGLACAVLHQPQVIFLDEPTAGVDPVNRRRFWELINGLASQGSTVIVTTHYMDEAEYCRKLMIMHEGRVVALDSPGGLKKRLGKATVEEAFVELVTAGKVGGGDSS